MQPKPFFDCTKVLTIQHTRPFYSSVPLQGKLDVNRLSKLQIVYLVTSNFIGAS